MHVSFCQHVNQHLNAPFNSLFEMRGFVIGVLIVGIILFQFSIRDAKCRRYRELGKDVVTFNSLFEMRNKSLGRRRATILSFQFFI